MKIISSIIFYILFYFSQSSAQKENKVWHYGRNQGLDFSSGLPILFSSPMTTWEASSSVCDDKGNLLFYTNGLTVWDKTNTPMPNGNGLLGAYSTTQGAVAVPIKGHPDLYFLFTIEETGALIKGKLHYSLIDMSLNGGLGDVVSTKKNLLLDSGMSEKMLVCPGPCGAWLITHHYDSGTFYAYFINESLTISPAVVTHYKGAKEMRAYSCGDIQISPNNKLISLCNTASAQELELFSFDENTGKLGDFMVLSSVRSNINYSSCFSPNSLILYTTIDGYITQYDLSMFPSKTDILASKTQLSSGIYAAMAAFRLGPDNKIYYSNSPNKICRINKPDTWGLGCDIEKDIPSLTSTNTEFYHGFGSNNIIRPKEIYQTTTTRWDTMYCNSISKEIKQERQFSNLIWNDGDTSFHKVLNKAGKYWRVSFFGCKEYIDTFVLTEKQIDTTVSVHADTTVCFQEKLNISATPGYSSYLWNDGSNQPSKSVNKSEVLWVVGTNNDCKLTIDSFTINLINFDLNIADRSICENEEIVLDATIPGATKYLWNNQSTEMTLPVNKNGHYWVEVSKEGCTKRKEINISPREFSFDFGADQTLCKGDKLTLNATIDGATYLWQNGSANQSFEVTENGRYTLKITDGGCSAEDSVYINFVQCNNCIAIPNAFSPNADGKNDFFKPLLNCPVLQYSLLIVNRYGEQLFSTNNTNDIWNGTFNNQEQQIGVYYYLIKVKFDYPASKEEVFKGDISLIK